MRAMPAGRAFISYRRDDTAGYAGRIYDRLQQRFPDQVFMDVSGIGAGVDFVESVEREVRASSVLVALIGKHWLDGGRLDSPDDLVNREIALAIASNIPVIPVLLRGARMPAEGDLPANLSALARRNAVELGEGTFDRDMAALIRALEPKLSRKAGTWKWIAAACIFALGAGVVVYTKKSEEPAPVVKSQPQTSGSPEIDALAKALGSIPPSPGPRGGQEAAGAPVVGFEPVGKWSVTAGGAASGSMLLNLKQDRNYDIRNPQGALQQLSTILGNTGTWTFDTANARLNLLPTSSRLGLGIRITGKQQNSFSAASADNDGVVYTFTRQ
jgi:TIR domain-containing protein